MLKHGIAIVISNSEYNDHNIINLPSCKKDGMDFNNTLRELGFDTILAINLCRDDVIERIIEFIELIPLYQTAFCYYSGHGLQIDGVNYIIPKDAKLVSNKELLIRTSLVDIELIINGFKDNPNKTNIIVLDAFRTNPFFSKCFTSKGLAKISAGAGTLISYATSPDDVSIGYGSESVNSLFTKYLIQNIKKPNLSIEDVFKLTRIDVENETDGNQIPWESTSLKGSFYFVKRDEDEINEEIYREISNSVDEGTTLVSLADKYRIGITDIYQRYYYYKMNLPGGIYLGDTEIYSLALKRVLDLGYYFKNYRWYFHGKPVRMGEFLHRVPILKEPLLDVSFTYNTYMKNGKVVLEIRTNLPDGMKFVCKVINPNHIQKNTVSGEVENHKLVFEFSSIGDSDEQIEVEIFNLAYSLQPESVLSIIGDKGQNIKSNNLYYDSINGYQINKTLIICKCKSN